MVFSPIYYNVPKLRHVFTIIFFQTRLISVNDQKQILRNLGSIKFLITVFLTWYFLLPSAFMHGELHSWFKINLGHVYSLSGATLDLAHIITWQNNNIMRLFMKLSDIHLFSKYFRAPLHVTHSPRHGDELKCQSQTCYTFSQNLNCMRYSEDPNVPMTSSLWVEIVFGLNQWILI